jgi:hypothetical protein
MTNKKQKPEADNNDGKIGVGSGDLLDHNGVMVEIDLEGAIEVSEIGIIKYEVEILPPTGRDASQSGQQPIGSTENPDETSEPIDSIAVEWIDKSKPTLRGFEAFLEIQRRSRLLRRKLAT